MGTFDLTLRDIYNKSLNEYQDKQAISDEAKTLTYGELNYQANQLSHALLDIGVHIETRVALLISNSVEFVISDLALMKVGATKVPLNDMLGKKEISYILNHSQAKAIIVGPEFYSIIQEVKEDLPELSTIISVTDDAPEGFIPLYNFIKEQPSFSPSITIKPENIAGISYTGGTTGNPKGVVHSQQNQVYNMFCHMIELNVIESERILISTPLPHSGGRYVLTGLLKGAYHVIRSKFDPEKTLELIESEKITLTFMVPTMIYRVLDILKEKKFDTSSLQTLIYGAAPITEERLKEGLHFFGPVFFQFYGLTECPNFISRLKKEDHLVNEENRERLRSCGKASIMSEVKIVNEVGEELPIGEQGEIAVKSLFTMDEYYKNPEKTNETLINGWLHTGDVGKMDKDGYIYLLDRKKDMIITGGMNVYSSEVENVLVQHPLVKQAAVIGIPHSDWGEQVLAFVIPKNDQVSKEEIIEFCNENLSKYKRPKNIEFVKEFPLTVYGKLNKKELRKPYWVESGRAIN